MKSPVVQRASRHGNHPPECSCRPEGRHRVFRRPRYQRSTALDAGQRGDPVRLHGQPGPAGRNRLRRDPSSRRAVWGREGAAHRLPRAAGLGGAGGASVRRVPHFNGRRALLQHDAHRPCRDRHHAGSGHEGGRGPHLGRWEHLQGQRHRALLSVRTAGQSAPPDLQTLARSGLHRRAGRAPGNVRVHEPGGLRLPDERREGVLDRFEHPRRDARGEGSRAPRHRDQDRPADHGRPVLARGCGHQA